MALGGIMAYRRQDAINELLRQELSLLIARQVKDPRVHTFTSVTSVEVSPDLRHAKVFISVMGDEKEQEETMAALRSASGFLRRALGSRVTMRYIPQLDLRLDRSIEHGERIMGLLRKLKKEMAEDTTGDGC